VIHNEGTLEYILGHSVAVTNDSIWVTHTEHSHTIDQYNRATLQHEYQHQVKDEVVDLGQADGTVFVSTRPSVPWDKGGLEQWSLGSLTRQVPISHEYTGANQVLFRLPHNAGRVIATSAPDHRSWVVDAHGVTEHCLLPSLVMLAGQRTLVQRDRKWRFTDDPNEVVLPRFAISANQYIFYWEGNSDNLQYGVYDAHRRQRVMHCPWPWTSPYRSFGPGGQLLWSARYGLLCVVSGTPISIVQILLPSLVHPILLQFLPNVLSSLVHDYASSSVLHFIPHHEKFPEPDCCLNDNTLWLELFDGGDDGNRIMAVDLDTGRVLHSELLHVWIRGFDTQGRLIGMDCG
jgi:hypothetical protein